MTKRAATPIYARGLNVSISTMVPCRYKTISGMDLSKLTCKQKVDQTVEKVSSMFTVLSFNSIYNLYVQSQGHQLRIL